MNALHQFMNQISPISDQSYQAYISLCSERSCKSGMLLDKIGEIPESIYFVKSGIARSYSISDKGVEYIRSLVSTNNILAATEALLSKSPSKIACQCLTDCEILEMKYKDLLVLLKENNEISAWYIKTLELHYAHLQKMNDKLLTLNATERYLRLQKRIPNIDNRINQYHIAANLGITPIQLSRIRKKLYNK